MKERESEQAIIASPPAKDYCTSEHPKVVMPNSHVLTPGVQQKSENLNLLDLVTVTFGSRDGLSLAVIFGKFCAIKL